MSDTSLYERLGAEGKIALIAADIFDSHRAMNINEREYLAVMDNIMMRSG